LGFKFRSSPYAGETLSRCRNNRNHTARFDASAEHETVSLISNLNNENGQTIGRLEVLLNSESG
jgi:hypothetical protein